MINYKKDKLVAMKIVQKKDYIQKDKMASCLYTKMRPIEDENKHQKMMSKESF